MIDKFRISGGVNEYATIQNPDEHKEEREQLIKEGYQPWSRYLKDGHEEELWVK